MGDFRTERRRAMRTPTAQPAQLKVDGQWHAATSRDVSATGVSVQSDVTVQPGRRITIGMALIGERSATVIWTKEGLIGARFKQPVQNEPETHFHRLIADAKGGWWRRLFGAGRR